MVELSLTGASMYPSLREGDVVTIRSITADQARIGDILAYQDLHTKKILIHRFIRSIDKDGRTYLITTGEGGDLAPDPPISDQTHAIGKVVSARRGSRSIDLESDRNVRFSYLWSMMIRYLPSSVFVRRLLCRFLDAAGRIRHDRKAAGIAALFFLFLALRLFRLGSHDFWYDEMATFDYLRYPTFNRNAPLYVVFMYLWHQISGTSEFWLRIPSVLFSFLSVYLTFLLGSRLFNKKAGLCAAVIMGLSPFHLWYAQEARGYSMALCLGLVSSLLLDRALAGAKNRTWVSFGIVSAAGLYTNYFYGFLFMFQFLFLACFRRRVYLFAALALFAAIYAAFLPGLPHFISRLSFLRQEFWINTPDFESLRLTLENMVLGYSGTPVLYRAHLAVCALAAACSLRALRDKRMFPGYVYCACVSLLPVISVFIFSKLLFSIYLDRAFLIFTPYYYLLLSAAVLYLSRKTFALLAAAFLSLVLVADCRYFSDKMIEPFKHHTGTYIKKPFKPLARFLNEHYSEKDDVFAVTNLSLDAVRAYYKQDLLFYVFFFHPGLIDENTRRPFREDSFYYKSTSAPGLPFRRLWVAMSDWPRSGQLDENSRLVKEELDRIFTLVFSRDFDGILLLGYEHKPSAAPSKAEK